MNSLAKKEGENIFVFTPEIKRDDFLPQLFDVTVIPNGLSRLLERVNTNAEKLQHIVISGRMLKYPDEYLTDPEKPWPVKNYCISYLRLNHDEIVDVYNLLSTGYPPLSGFYWAQRKEVAIFPDVSVLSQIMRVAYEEAQNDRKQVMDWSSFKENIQNEIVDTLLEEILHSAQIHRPVSKNEKASHVVYRVNRENQVKKYLADPKLRSLAMQAVNVQQRAPDEALTRILDIARELFK